MNALNNVIIFGATSAIAEHVARKLIARGASVYCIGRSETRLETLLQDLKVRAGSGQRVEGCAADLLATENHEGLIAAAVEALGSVDGVLIAHGSLPKQSECEASFEQTRHEIQTNAISVISLLTLLGNRFELQERGVIAVISSVAGDRGRKSNYVYGAAKGMVSIFMQGLRNRLYSKGVDVVTIKPGFVDTPMTAAFDKSGPLWAQPGQIATGIVTAMVRGKNDVYLPWFWQVIMLIIRHIPESVFKRLSL